MACHEWSIVYCIIVLALLGVYVTNAWVGLYWGVITFKAEDHTYSILCLLQLILEEITW